MRQRYYNYFRVEKGSDLEEGLLFTEKELKRIYKNDYFTFKHSNFAKVKVLNSNLYYLFGGRFSDVFNYSNF